MHLDPKNKTETEITKLHQEELKKDQHKDRSMCEGLYRKVRI